MERFTASRSARSALGASRCCKTNRSIGRAESTATGTIPTTALVMNTSSAVARSLQRRRLRARAASAARLLQHPAPHHAGDPAAIQHRGHQDDPRLMKKFDIVPQTMLPSTSRINPSQMRGVRPFGARQNRLEPIQRLEARQSFVHPESALRISVHRAGPRAAAAVARAEGQGNHARAAFASARADSRADLCPRVTISFSTASPSLRRDAHEFACATRVALGAAIFKRRQAS
jgi:hypothetical protein